MCSSHFSSYSIPVYPSINKLPLVMKYITGIFNWRPPKPKLRNDLDVDALFECIDRLRDITLFTNVIIT